MVFPPDSSTTASKSAASFLSSGPPGLSRSMPFQTGVRAMPSRSGTPSANQSGHGSE
jgi:hypothetical protein